MRKARHLSLSILTLIFLTHTLFVSPANAQGQWDPGSGCYEVVDNANIATLKGIQCVVVNLISTAIRLIGIVGFLMLAFGGIKILISGGEPKALAAGQQTLTFAIGGIILAVVSWFILQLIEQFTGVPVTQFEFPTL